MAKPISLSTPDRFGYTPDTSILGQHYQHSGSGDVYRVIGFTFLADTDEWGVRFRRPDNGAMCFTRSVVAFFGTREGRNRFVPRPDFVPDEDLIRSEVAAILETVAREGLEHPRDMDVALDAIFCATEETKA